jgi:cobalt ECF transporter T component CbiQ
MIAKLPDFLQCNEPERLNSVCRHRKRLSFVDFTLGAISRFVKTGFIQLDMSSKTGLMQSFNPQVKAFFLLTMIILISLLHSEVMQLWVTLLIVILYVLSNVSICFVYKRLLLTSFVFGFLVVAPAMVNLFSKGEIIYSFIHFQSEYKWWIYHLPKDIGITKEGVLFVVRFFLRVFNSVSVVFLILYTTSFNDIVKSFKVLHVPDMFLMVVLLTWKFLFVLTQTLEESYLAIKSRWWNHVSGGQARQIVAGRVSYIFRRAWTKYDEMYNAMISRGYTGKVRVNDPKKWRARDYVFLGCTTCVCLVIIFF